jgi:hypothetical protein
MNAQTFILTSPTVVLNASSLLHNLPADGTFEAVFRKVTKVRTPDQNSAMWAGPLRDIEEQAWVQGKQFKADVWHEYFKREYLPELDDPEIERLAKKGYRKWDFLPDGTRELVGSTTQLTTTGMARYLTQIEAYGGDLGVRFHVSPNQEF